MTKFLSLVSLLISTGLYSQVTDTAFPSEIKTTKQKAHVNIPGTRVFIIPPEGFRISDGLPAIDKNGIGLVQAMDLVGGSFYTNAATFSKEKFEQRGVKVFEYKELTINGFPAKLAVIESEPNAKVYNLVFGDSTFSTMIVGAFQMDDITTGTQVRQAILSIYYDKSNIVDPFAKSNFKLDDSKSIFKFAKYSASLYIYSIGGENKPSYEDDPYVMVVAVPSNDVSLKKLADNMVEILDNRAIKNEKESKTNGYTSLRREVYGKLNGKPVLMYQHLVLLGSTIVLMQGTADESETKYIAEFEKLSNTITIK